MWAGRFLDFLFGEVYHKNIQKGQAGREKLMKKSGVKAVMKAAHQELKRKRSVTVVYLVLRLMVILIMVAQFFNRNFENVFLCLLTLVLFLLPTIFERRLRIDLPDTLEIIIMLFIFIILPPTLPH